MSLSTDLKQPYSHKLIGLNPYFTEMVKLYKLNKFPKVLLLNGRKGIGKFTLVFHFINYIFSKNENSPYNLQDKVINIKSPFYNLLTNKISQNIILLQAEENKNIKIDDIRFLKSKLSNTTLSKNSRFIVIDEVEFLNNNSVNALLKTLEEPSDNNFFILINNQQADLVETISSRCIKTNIFLNSVQRNEIVNYLIAEREIECLIESDNNLSPGLFFRFNEIYSKYKINQNDSILIKLSTLINAYKKSKDKSLINLVYYLIDRSFFQKIQNNKKELEFLLDTKSSIVKIINNFVQFNLNINSVMNSIETKLNNV